MSPPKYYSVEQVAEMYGISRNSVERLIASGELAAIDVHAAGKRPRLRIPATALVAFDKNRAV